MYQTVKLKDRARFNASANGLSGSKCGTGSLVKKCSKQYTTLSDARVPSALDSLYLVVCPYRHLPCFHPPPAVVQTALRYAGRRKAEGLGRRSDDMVLDVGSVVEEVVKEYSAST